MTSYCEDDPEKLERAARENQTYEMKKKKKEIIRKRCMADTQTPCRVVKSTGILTTEIVTENAEILASEWDIYDTYNSLDKCEASKNFLKFIEPIKSSKPSEEPPTEEEVSKVFGSSRFRYASLVTERLLASNFYQSKQSVFKKDYKTRYDLEPTLYAYTIQPLWSFHKKLESPLAVTTMDWNPSNQESITSLHYSRVRPNILAVATSGGNVFVVDTSTEEGRVRLLGSSDPHPGPIWKVEWFLFEELVDKTEELLAVGESGVLMVYSTSIEKSTKDIIKLKYVSSTLKYPEKIDRKKVYTRPPVFYETFEKKTFSGLCFSICTSKNLCYISTKEGVLIKCSLLNPSMTDGVFLAHEGPAYIVQHSPVTDLIFLTCGADWCVKIWMEGISEPLLSLQQKAPVTCARWSPTIPTLIATVADSELSLWDIARNVLSPKSHRNFEKCGKTCNLLFSSNGANITIGSDDGQVHVVHLSELPRIPFLQKEALVSAIGRALSRNKNELYVKFRREAEANKDELKTKVLAQLHDERTPKFKRANLQEFKEKHVDN